MEGRRLRVKSPLGPEEEVAIQRTIGCAIEVHRALGPGLLEKTYVRAMVVELQHHGLPFEVEHVVPVRYRGELLNEQRLDLVVAQRVVVEIKAVARLAAVHHAQLLSYLRASGLRAGLLINFNVHRLPEGLKRMVL